MQVKSKLFVSIAGILLLSFFLVLSSTGCSSGSRSAPPEVTKYARDWPLPDKDYSNTRAATNPAINSKNVSSLGVAWAFPIPGSGLFGSCSTNPIVMGQTVYFQDLANNIIALDFKTGALKWKQMYNGSNIGPNGVAVGWGKVFATVDPYHIAALDTNSGKELWRTRISDVASVGTDIQPTVYGGKVFTSTVPGAGAGNFYAGGGAGYLYALDQATGKVVWNWNTVDSENIWGNKAVNSGGGAWYSPAVDVITGNIFWGIGNPAPFPGTRDFPNGTSRPGPNLYCNSMVSLDSGTGKLLWYNQVAPHDIRDWDFQIAPILAKATIKGTPTDIVIGAGKMGKVVAFHRQTGAQIWSTKVGKHENDEQLEFPANQTTTVFPGIFGGVETPMAYADGVVYVPVVNLATDFTPSSLKTPPFTDGTGELLAIDVSTGNVLWDKQMSSLNVGGATVVNDLVFTATYEGIIYAFDRKTGDQVWTFKAPGGINAWPAVVGDTIVWPVGIGAIPSLIAFRPGATSPMVNISPESGTKVPSGDLKVSAQVFNFNVANKLGQPNAVKEGHLHYFMDVDAPTAQGKPAVTASGTYTATSDTSYVWTNVNPGTHTLSVELVNNDHTPLNPPVVAKNTVTVIPATPAVSITFPANNASVSAGDILISVKVSSFSLVNKIGQPNALNEGHLIYFKDVEAPTVAGQPVITAAGTSVATVATSYNWPGVSQGTHTFSVALVNNDNTPLNPAVVAKINLTVSAVGQGGP